jgi:FixJ family two-component response regulator
MIRPIRIAVVDDDQSVRESLLGLVESVGYDADLFGSAEDFLKLPHPDQFDCLILDVRLPGMSGFELYCALRIAHKLIPTVFITAHADGAAQSCALAQGAEAFFLKPFKPAALLDAVRAAVGKSKSDCRFRRKHDLS